MESQLVSLLEQLREKTGLAFEEAKDSKGRPVWWVGRLNVSRVHRGYHKSGSPARLNIYYNRDYRQPIDPTVGDAGLADRRWKAVLKAIEELIPADKLGGK